MRRTLSLLAILLLTPTIAFSQARMRPSTTHPPVISPSADIFGAASSSSVSGVVSAVNGNLISIASGLIVIDATDAKVTGPDGKSAAAVSIAPGNLITAQLKDVDVAAGKALPAAFIAVIKFPEAEISGPVQSVDTAGQTLTVLGQTISVTPQTRFVGGFFGQTSPGLGDLQKGQFVHVAAANAAGGRLVADYVVMEATMSLPTVTRLHGKVKSIGTDSWTLTDDANKDVIVVVNNDTKILGSPVNGSTVDILAIIDSSGRYVAVAIINSEGLLPSVPPIAFYHGVVKKISSGEWVVNDNTSKKDLTFIISPITRIESGIAVNDRVIVTARTDDFKNLVAYVIVRER